jgi:hypothetical protein
MTERPTDSHKKLISDLVRSELGLILDSDVFVRTLKGQREALERTRDLPHRLRVLLMLIDGRRSVGNFRAAMTNYRSLDDAIDMLMRMDMIQRIAPKNAPQPPLGPLV